MSNARPDQERLVCHNCGAQLAVGVKTSPALIRCCERPDIHIHDTAAPCERCSEKPPPTILPSDGARSPHN